MLFGFLVVAVSLIKSVPRSGRTRNSYEARGMRPKVLGARTWQTCFAGLALFTALSVPLACSAQIPSWGVDEFQAPPDPAWRDRAVRDVDAAFYFLQENHPGAAPELGDKEFLARLQAAHVTAATRAKTIASAQGYNAVLAGFATDMGDKHIWSRPTLVLNLPYWAGAVIAKHGSNWDVASSDKEAGSPPEGAQLISCDGIPAGLLAERNLGGFHASWRIEAQQYQAAPWLFVDEGNPFIRRPETCVFKTSRGETSLKLSWKRIKREELLPKLKAGGGGGAAGFGIRKVGDGYWVALQNLMDQGAEVAKNVEAQQAVLRSAPFVVIDVRGNGGGSSDVGTRIASVFWGTKRARAVEGGDNCGDDLRASPGNVADMEFLVKALGPVLSPEAKANLEKEVISGKDALAHGRSFNRPPVCQASRHELAGSLEGRDLPKESGTPIVILLTDNLCFSACLVLTDDFRRLGALHVGQTTDAATHFTEVREQHLPSGYSLFSTLQAVAPGEPADVGPFVPHRVYQGDIADTAAVEQWVLGQITPKR